MKTTLKAAALVLAGFAVTATPSIAKDNAGGEAQAKIAQILKQQQKANTQYTAQTTKQVKTQQQRVLSTSMPLSSVERAHRNIRSTQTVHKFGGR